MRLHDDGIPGREAREQAGIAVPGRKGLATDDQRDPAGNDAPVLLDDERRRLALRLLPRCRGRGALHLDPGCGHRFQSTVLRVRTARLKGHRECLAGGVHHRVAHLEAHRVQPRQRLEEEPDAGLGRRGRPVGGRRFGGGDQRRRVGGRIGDAERRAPGRDLGPTRPDSGWPGRGNAPRVAPGRRSALPRVRSRHRTSRSEPPEKASRIRGPPAPSRPGREACDAGRRAWPLRFPHVRCFYN